MATDDDKQLPEQDPWAGLDIGGAEDKGEDFAFSFDGLGEEVADGDEPMIGPPAGDHSADEHPAEHESQPVVASIHGSSDDKAFDQGEPHDREPSHADESPFGGEAALEDDGQRDAAAGEIPLALFPPPDAESAGSEILIGTGQSGIISMADAVERGASDDFGGGDGVDDAFDDKDIAHELGLLDIEGEAIAAEALASGEDLDAAADFGEPVNEAHSDDVSFDAGMMGGTPPFADSEPFEPAADAAEPWQDDPASIPLNPSVAVAGAAVAAAGAAVASTGGRPAVAKKKGGGLGQMVGVVLGGLMALPITYAILIWGFQKDPFKFGKQMPPQLAFLLPQKLQPGYKPPKKPAAGSNLDAVSSPDDAPSLDDVPLAEEATPPAAAVAAEPVDSDAELADAKPAEPMETAVVAASPAEGAGSAEPIEPAPSAEPAAAPVIEADITDTGAAAPAMAAASSLAALPPSDALSGLDALVAATDTAVPAAPASAVPALPPLDLTGVEMAAERATQAFESLEFGTRDTSFDAGDPAHDRALVTWYRRLAQLGEELVRLETMAADSGSPLSPTPAAAADLFDRICVSDTAVAELDRLGRMWLTSQKRRNDGVAVVATLGASRQVGPYWSTRASVAGAHADGTDRSLSIISRLAPPADVGDRVLVAGVMFDGDAVWAADMRPVAPQPVSGSDPE